MVIPSFMKSIKQIQDERKQLQKQLKQANNRLRLAKQILSLADRAEYSAWVAMDIIDDRLNKLNSELKARSADPT
jgi:septal ring factor EnvC (AmiA/AmiB activator)